MRKNTLIPENLLCDVYRLIYYLVDIPVPNYVKSLCDAIEIEIVDIIKRRELHTAYSAYKTAPPGQQRESLRLDYIKLVDIHRSFVNKREIPYSSL